MGVKLLSIVFREEHRLKVFDNMALKVISDQRGVKLEV
jgi:hypothetical protein